MNNRTFKSHLKSFLGTLYFHDLLKVKNTIFGNLLAFICVPLGNLFQNQRKNIQKASRTSAENFKFSSNFLKKTKQDKLHKMEYGIRRRPPLEKKFENFPRI